MSERHLPRVAFRHMPVTSYLYNVSSENHVARRNFNHRFIKAKNTFVSFVVIFCLQRNRQRSRLDENTYNGEKAVDPFCDD